MLWSALPKKTMQILVGLGIVSHWVKNFNRSVDIIEEAVNK